MKLSAKPGSVGYYPVCCKSANCGKHGNACVGCENKAGRDAFWVWVKATGAKPRDPIWNPNVYEVPTPENA